MIEYRLCWNASSNISFRGATGWEPADEETEEEVQHALTESQGGGAPNLSLALEMVLEASGLDWWVETREVAE